MDPDRNSRDKTLKRNWTTPLEKSRMCGRSARKMRQFTTVLPDCQQYERTSSVRNVAHLAISRLEQSEHYEAHIANRTTVEKQMQRR